MKIAIQGHPTRGEEVIQILESLGGKNNALFMCDSDFWYFINSDGHIRNDYQDILIKAGFKTYTLEEFEKEFPFKVGDMCIYYSGFLDTEIIVKILGMAIENDCVVYEVGHKDTTKVHSGIYRRKHTLKPYKEMKEERNITLTIEKAQEWYKKGGELKEIALQAFTEKELNSLPKSWEEFITNRSTNGYYISRNGEPLACCFSGKFSPPNICPSQKSAEAHLAMMQLEQLRNCWWNGWEPEWSNCEKYVIKWDKNDLMVFTARNIHAFLVFPTREMAEEFLMCFRDLIEKAGDLI